MQTTRVISHINTHLLLPYISNQDVGDTTKFAIAITVNGQQYHPASAHASPKINGTINGAHSAGMPMRGIAMIDKCLSVFTYRDRSPSDLSRTVFDASPKYTCPIEPEMRLPGSTTSILASA